MVVLLIAVAVVMGLVSAYQGVANGILAGRIGLWAAVLINAVVVLVGSATMFLLLPRGGEAHPPPSPWYLYLGGVCGLTFLAGAAFAFPRLGAGPTTAVMVATMLAVSMVFDHLGLPHTRIPVTPSRLLGAVLLVAGALLVLWPKLTPR